MRYKIILYHKKIIVAKVRPKKHWNAGVKK